MEIYNIHTLQTEVYGKGPESPLVEENSEEGQAKNRRVEFAKV